MRDGPCSEWARCAAKWRQAPHLLAIWKVCTPLHFQHDHVIALLDGSLDLLGSSGYRLGRTAQRYLQLVQIYRVVQPPRSSLLSLLFSNHPFPFVQTSQDQYTIVYMDSLVPT